MRSEYEVIGGGEDHPAFPPRKIIFEHPEGPIPPGRRVYGDVTTLMDVGVRRLALLYVEQEPELFDSPLNRERDE